MSSKTKAAPEAITLQQAVGIPLNLLDLSPDNVRNIYDTSRIASLADSIARVGLLEPLGTRPVIGNDGEPTGRQHVVYGGRRFRALQLLLKQKRIRPDEPISCVPASQGITADISLVENAERDALHPLDEFRAFKAMIDAGKSIDDAAAAYRVTPAVVRQRMRMASASPKVIKAYEKDEIQLDHLMAFCATEDHKKQDSVLKGIKNGSIHHHPAHIKRAVTEDTVSANDPRARFIGVDAYVAAGGAVLPDLFGDENHVFLTDTDLVNRMLDDKLAVTRDAELAKGWKWAVAAAHIPYDEKYQLDELLPLDPSDEEQDRIAKLESERDELQEITEPTKKQVKRLEAIEAQLEAAENAPPTFAPEDMARAGVFITINREGELDIDYGYIRPEDRLHSEIPEHEQVASSKPGTRSNGNGHTAATPGADHAEAADDAPKPLSEKLLQNLTAFRTVGLRNAFANNFDVAFVAVLHAFVANRFYSSSTLSCLQITTSETFAANTPGLDTWPATKTMDARHSAWKQRLPKDEKDLFAALLQMDVSDRQALFAHCAAATLNAVNGRGQFGSYRNAQVKTADEIATALDFSMVQAGWTTTAENYFSRVTKNHIMAAVEEAAGADKANLISHMTKGGMAAEAQRLIDGTGWLPEAIRTPIPADASATEGGDDTVPAFLQQEADAEAATA